MPKVLADESPAYVGTLRRQEPWPGYDELAVEIETFFGGNRPHGCRDIHKARRSQPAAAAALG
jgi:hypothetical protein